MILMNDAEYDTFWNKNIPFLRERCGFYAKITREGRIFNNFLMDNDR